jgi:hypothetical protein
MAEQQPEAAYTATVRMLQEHAKNAPYVTQADILDVASMDPMEMRRRMIVSRDWHGQFSHCLDGIPEIQAMPGAGIDGCRMHREVRAVVTGLLDQLKSARAALSRLQAGGGEVVATLHDDGYWTPAKSEAGRALNERLMRAGTRVEVCLPHPAAPAKVLVPLPTENALELIAASEAYEYHDGAILDLLRSYERALATHNGLALGDGGEMQG